MANILTGDFDVVAQFAVLAVDRILAAMHQTGRFLHSISARVDDNPHPTRPGWPTFVGVVDTFGDAVANHRQIGTPNPFPGSAAATNAIYSRFGTVLNADQLVETAGQTVPSHISGTVQLQLFPPTVVVPDASGTNLTVSMNLMARFFPDKNTAPLAQFLRGDLSITSPITKIVSGGMGVIDIDFRADTAVINFTSSYSSPPLSPEDIAGINLCIQNALQTSFLPSSVTLPASIADVQLKTLPGAIVVMLDLNDHTPASTPSSVTNVFLGGTDDFAFAVGRDYLLNTLRLISDNILSQSIPPVTFSVDLGFWGVGTTLHYSYAIQLHTASFDLQPGKIVLTITGHAGPAQHAPSEFNFTITVDFSLLPAGDTVELDLGSISVSTDSSIAGIVDFFTGDITSSVQSAISAAISATNANSMVDTMFNADTNLGNFLNAQLNPTDSSTQFQSQQVFLVYNSVDIQTAGIVLHGSLLVFDWPAPYVEFEPVPPNTSVQNVGGSPAVRGTDYSALKTWIPGGTIAQYEWSVQGQEQAYPFDIDPNRFVLLNYGELQVSAPVAAAVASSVVSVPGYVPLCLTIIGNRISNYGSPPAYQQVTAGICGYTSFPLPLGGIVGTRGSSALMLAVTRPAPSGGVIVSGQASIAIDGGGSAAPNLLVLLADSKSASHLYLLTQALARSNRTDAPTAIVAVLTPDQLSKAPFTAGVIYAEDHDGSWPNALGVTSSKRPLALIFGPLGNLAWQKEGALDVDDLAAALTKHLVKRPPVKLGLPRLNLHFGQPAPNFLVEYASGRKMPISKFAGPLTLIFWKSSVKTSIQAVRDLQAPATKALAGRPSALKGNSLTPIILAINDGEDPEAARAVAAENGITAMLVTDPKREISLAYGVSHWPTIVTVDAAGAVAGIRYGYVPDGTSGLPSNPSRSGALK